MSSEAEPVVKCDDCRKRSRDDTETADTEVIVARTLYAAYTQTDMYTDMQITRSSATADGPCDMHAVSSKLC